MRTPAELLTRSALIIGALFSLTGLAIAAKVESYLAPMKVTPVDAPISLQPGETVVKFQTGIKANYRVAIEFDRPQRISFKSTDCVTAEYFPRGDCNGIPAGFEAAWSLAADGKQVASGKASKVMWQLHGPFSLEFGQFGGRPSEEYILRVQVLTDGSRLALAKPRLQVSVWEPEFINWYPGFKVLARFVYGIPLAFAVALTIAGFLDLRNPW